MLAVGAVGLSGSDTGALAVDVETSAGLSKSAASLVGLTIDGFAIEGVLGGGSFGTVYRGRQVGLDRAVAIKVPTHEIAADPVMAKRFAREARSASRVVHPGVVAIHGVGELPDGRPYIAMQMVEGDPLDKILEGGPVPPIRALKIARQVASALGETHAAGVVHRDLKPSNIVWRHDRNGDDRITIVDFGIAVSKPGSADATRLTTGGLIGTPHYMSPEQAHGEVVDARADLYALGCILFELVTGTTPYDGSAFEVLLAHLGRPAPPPSERVSTIPPSVDTLVGKLMAKRPDDRVATADLAVTMIDDVLDELEAVHAPVLPAPPARPTGGGRARRKTAAPTQRDRPAIKRAASPIPTAPFDSEIAESETQKPATARMVPSAAQVARPGRWIALGAAATLLLCATALVVVRLSGGPAAASSLVTGRSADSDRASGARREIVAEDGDMRIWVSVPDPTVVDTSRMQRLRIELRNKLGAPVAPESVVVTIEDPNGKAVGAIARPRQENPEQLGFGHRFAMPGTHIVRIFPPDSASTFDIPIDVQ